MSRATVNVRDRPYFDSPETSRPMVHDHLGDPPAQLTRESRQVPVHPWPSFNGLTTSARNTFNEQPLSWRRSR